MNTFESVFGLHDELNHKAFQLVHKIVEHDRWPSARKIEVNDENYGLSFYFLGYQANAKRRLVQIGEHWLSEYPFRVSVEGKLIDVARFYLTPEGELLGDDLVSIYSSIHGAYTVNVLLQALTQQAMASPVFESIYFPRVTA